MFKCFSNNLRRKLQASTWQSNEISWTKIFDWVIATVWTRIYCRLCQSTSLPASSSWYPSSGLSWKLPRGCKDGRCSAGFTGRDVGVVLGGGGGGGGRVWGSVLARGRRAGGAVWHSARLGLVDDGPPERFGDPKGCEPVIEVVRWGLGKDSTLKY